MNTEQKCCDKPRKFLSISTRWGRRLICNACGAPWKGEKVDQFPTEQKCCPQCSSLPYKKNRDHFDRANAFCEDDLCPCHRTEQKCICLEDNKLTQALCPVHSKRHTEQKGWREEFDYRWGKCGAGLFEPTAGPLPQWEKASKERIKAFIERTLQEETTKAVRAYQEELVKKIEGMKTITGNAEAKIGADAFKRAVMGVIKSNQI